METNSLLGYALLGLLHQHAMSGYDLRKIFTTTAMGSFSDSPGAIYPALKRLEGQGLIRGTEEASTGQRKRRVFKITREGLAELKRWLTGPVTRNDIIRGLGTLMLRFAFMDQVTGPGHSADFLRCFAEQIAAYLPELERFLEANRAKMPLSARLALESGIQEYALRLKWARTAITQYEPGKRNRV